jgi:light-regulated signal transduction histidine kinase (bacteriophytochrome)
VDELLQEALRDLECHAEQLERSNRDLEQFAYAASHDLQTPLRKVKSFSMLLLEELQPELKHMPAERREKLEKYFRFVIDGANRSQELINGLLSFSRIGRKLEKEEFPLDQSLDDALFILEEDIKEKGVAVLRRPLPVVVADPTLMARVFQNLVGNAIKFRQDGTVPRVEIGAEDREENWCLYVRDNGIGLDPRHYDRIFVIFQRIGVKKQGTGLGLALCKKIVESHGGHIWVESSPGEGATFYFTLPKEPVSHEAVDVA